MKELFMKNLKHRCRFCKIEFKENPPKFCTNCGAGLYSCTENNGKGIALQTVGPDGSWLDAGAAATAAWASYLQLRMSQNVTCSKCHENMDMSIHESSNGIICDKCHRKEWEKEIASSPYGKTLTTLAEVNKASEEMLTSMYSIVKEMVEEQDKVKRAKLADKYMAFEKIRKQSLRIKL